ncbi:MAG TPA: glycosyltransferase family 2 protein [Caldithrix abyssi]|uniref:Glycosyltransferase family 2 protein n=1 Tax=Caldithrix abyssi TaxID=187145 RepID=A0A7V5RPJ5_CALAY|nr:glycosyltransferase family 2 protein [Caldithrix abyssi]
MILEMVFWFLLFLLVYIYAGYPVLSMVLAKMFPSREPAPPQEWPSLTMVISAYNEETVIAEKLNNSLQLDYPRDRFQIVVISDASEDKTDDIVSHHDDGRVSLIRVEGRRGKTHGISVVVPQLKSELVVFSDANAIYKKDALKKLVAHFADEKVGYVVGNAQYYKENQSSAGEHESTYWDMEVKLKMYESRLSSVVGGDGAIYAIRTSLFLPMEDDDINDFVNPLQIITQGYRGVFEAGAVCYEHTADSFEKEIGRKRRIVNRSWRGLMKNKSVLNPFKTGFHAFQVFSHKMLRWLGGVFLLAFFIVNIFLWREHWIYQLSLAAQILFFLLALTGRVLVRRNGSAPFLFSTPYYFMAVNFASIMGIIDNYLGRKYTTWQTIREA